MFINNNYFPPYLFVDGKKEAKALASGRRYPWLNNYRTISFLFFFFDLEDSRESVLVRRTRKLKLGRRD